jgi:hypothetical protein
VPLTDVSSAALRAKVSLAMRSATAAVAPLVAALVIAGCGSSGSSTGSKHASAGATIARAAFVSSGEPGYQMKLAMTENLGTAGQMTATGTGSFSTTDKSGTMSLNMTVPGTGAALGPLAMQLVIKGQNFYMKLPPSLSSIVPGGKQWMALNLGQLGKASNLPGLGSLVQSEGSMSNPGQYISYLRAASATGVKNLGTETVDGVKTTHYRADLDLNRLAAVVPAADRAATEQLVAKLKTTTHVSYSPIDAWIDSDNRVRRIALTYAMTVPVETGQAAQRVTLNLTEDFTSYGPQPVPAAPPAGQTEQLTSLLHAL